MISSEKLLARSEIFTTSVNTLVVINIVLPAANKEKRLITSSLLVFDNLFLKKNVLLSLVGVGETKYRNKNTKVSYFHFHLLILVVI